MKITLYKIYYYIYIIINFLVHVLCRNVIFLITDYLITLRSFY